MNIGERHVIQEEEWEVVSRGTPDEDGDLNVTEGRIPEDGDSGMLLQAEDDPEDLYWLERVTDVDARNRKARLEMAMDELMPEVRKRLMRFEEDGVVPFAITVSLVRAACAEGYHFGINESPQGALELSFE